MIPLAARPLTRVERLRAIGVVVGAAVGDALGAPFEFQPGGTYPRRFPQPVLGGIGEMVGGGNFDWAPGEFTDDTQMAMALGESLLRCGGYDADDVWRSFRAWRSVATDVGIATSRALRHEDWRDVPPNPNGAGNGALMRGFVVPLAYAGAPDDALRDVVLAQARLTHSDPSAGWGAWIAAEMVRSALRGDDPLAVLPRLAAQLPEDVRRQFAPLLAPSWTPDHATLTNGTVWVCLAQAVWALRTTSSFEDAVVAAVSLGDDADTVACVTGALAGARYGVQVIPSRWAAYVHGRVNSPSGELRYHIADLQRMALRLVGAEAPADEPPERAERPREVDAGVYAANLPGAATVPTDWAVVSLCRTGDHFAGHPIRRQLYLIDQEGDHNPALSAAVRDAADAVDAFVAEGRTVVVHCHGGRSRTGLVLKAWKMRRDGLTEREAHTWLSERWFLYQDYNETYLRFLREHWP